MGQMSVIHLTMEQIVLLPERLWYCISGLEIRNHSRCSNIGSLAQGIWGVSIQKELKTWLVQSCLRRQLMISRGPFQSKQFCDYFYIRIFNIFKFLGKTTHNTKQWIFYSEALPISSCHEADASFQSSIRTVNSFPCYLRIQ